MNVVRDGRALPTELHLPSSEPPWPLVVFAHGWKGHPRKFARLFARLSEDGFAVAAPAFPHTSDESGEPIFEDVANQPADVRVVLDRLLEDERFDARRVAVGGLSLGAATVHAVAFDRAEADERVRAVVALSGRGAWFVESEPRPVPLLVVSGRHDEVVAYSDGLDTYRRALPPKALLTVEVRGHSDFVEDVPATAADGLVRDVTVAFLEQAVNGATTGRPDVDPSLARLETEGIW